MKKTISLLLILLLSFTLVGCSTLEIILEDLALEDEGLNIEEDLDKVDRIDENGYYTSKEDVALYIYSYDKLPDNYITKKEAIELGWESNKGNLWQVSNKKSIGGDKFGNREGILPKSQGRQYYECDIDYQGGYRGPKRIVYSNDGLIYYTDDHYKSFTLLYGEE